MKLCSNELPNHQALVICYTENDDTPLPAIYYDNQSFKGFYFYTSFYHNENSVYKKVRLKDKHKIENVISWKKM